MSSEPVVNWTKRYACGAKAERAANACGDARSTDSSARESPTQPRVPPGVAGTAADDPPSSQPNVFRREGDYWSVTFGGRTARLRDAKGFRYLARLLADPG